MAEKHEFTTENGQLMNLIVNKFYSNKEIFLRELLCNSSDAIDKCRFERSQKNESTSASDYCITLETDNTKNTLLISDNGVGMSKSELISNLGTIAKSGTLEYEHKINKIGSFGVGFYSVFLVATKVVVETRRDGDSCWHVWESYGGVNGGDSGFIVYDTSNDDVTNICGTKVHIYLKDTQLEFLNKTKLESCIQKYVGFLNYNINYCATSSGEYSLMSNGSKPIWSCKRIVEKSEIEILYKTLMPSSSTGSDYLAFKQFSVEGEFTFNGVLFVPATQSSCTVTSQINCNNLKIYVKNVFVHEQTHNEYMPEYFNFVIGIVDFEDLPLSISREIVQESDLLKKVLKKNLKKKCVEMFEEMYYDDNDKYAKFYSEYSKFVKYAIIEETDETLKNRLVSLLRFNSCYTGGVYSNVSLKDYVARMCDNQSGIFYSTGENRTQITNSSQTLSVMESGCEVLIFDEAIDVYLNNKLIEFDGQQLICIKKEELHIFKSDTTTPPPQNNSDDYTTIIAKMRAHLVSSDTNVVDVKISHFLSDQVACCIQTSQDGWTVDMERAMKSHALVNSEIANQLRSKKVVEINVNNKIIKSLNIMCKNDTKPDELNNLISLIYEMALVDAGYPIIDSSVFQQRILFYILKYYNL